MFKLKSKIFVCIRMLIDSLHKWRLNLNNNTHTSLASHSSENSFVLKHGCEAKDVPSIQSYSNLGAIYAKGLSANLKTPSSSTGERSADKLTLFPTVDQTFISPSSHLPSPSLTIG